MNYNEVLENAVTLAEEKRYDEILEMLEPFKKEGKDDIKWCYRYSNALVFFNRFKEAIDILENVVPDYNGDYPYGHLLLGSLYYRQGDLLEGFKLVEKGMEMEKGYEPEYLWEFDYTLRAIYSGYPFANRDNFKNTVFLKEFPNYDESIDAEYKVKDVSKERARLEEYLESYEGESLNFNLIINGRLSTKFRHLYEDNICTYLSVNKLGILKAGATFVDDNNRIKDSTINFDVFTEKEDYKEKVLKLLRDNIVFPRGSYIEIDNAEKEIIKLKGYDVLAIGLDGHNLSDETYEKHSLDDVVISIFHAFDDENYDVEYFFYDETDGRLWIRFLGEDYDKMKRIIKDAVKDNPLCQNSLIINETDFADEE